MDENFVKKVMPHNLEAEKSVIGSIFIDREAATTVSEYQMEKIFIKSNTEQFMRL